ncbi:hypothetical protein [Glutamicibacter sp.]|uniref:hypothetical protein n=1 Tax=Glutamicibacter sp. TaxID=1931995 RepID=UPI002FE2A271
MKREPGMKPPLDVVWPVEPSGHRGGRSVRAGAVPGIDLGLDDPPVQGFCADAQLGCKVLAGTVDGLVAVQPVQDVGDGVALDFRSVLVGHVFHSLK